MAQLALTTAASLDQVVASGERQYVVDRLTHAHLMVLRALEDAHPPDEPNAWDELMAEIMKPMSGTPDAQGERL